MDDPWLNAWGEPQTSSKHITDDQDDISAPSWAQQEPDTTWDHSQNLWSSENPQRWSTPTFDSIAFARPRTDTLTEPSETVPDLEQDATEDLDSEQTPSAPESADSPLSTPVLDTEPPPTNYQPQPQSSPEPEVGNVSKPSSPDLDGFGTFEAAADVIPQLDPWTPAKPSFPQAEEAEDWGTSWNGTEDTAQIEGQKADEWEIAKRQKEIQDQYVPPELLGSILHQFDEFSQVYWGKDDSEIPLYQHNRNELADTMGIASITERLIPSDLSLPIPPVFSKTFISKEMIEALKLTKHHPVTRCGPFATYMNSKGSLTWEAAVKSKSDVTEADVVPTGWRIVPKETTEQQSTVNESQKKAGVGLLSFFGRKSASNTSESVSPINPSTPKSSSSRPSLSSPRPSTDGDTIKALKTTLPIVSSQGADTTPTESLSTTKPLFVNKVEPTPSPMSRDDSVDSAVTLPQSAVSRFFGRFSRTSRQTSANSRKSIALSSDDIEFLSDIVPSASEEMSHADQLNALSDMLNSPPVPTKLPPPLAPPPRPPPLSKTLSSSTFSQRSGQTRLFDLETVLTSPPTASPTSSSTSHPFVPVGLLPPLSPSTSSVQSFKSHPPPITAPIPSVNSFCSDDDFADFQTPEASTSSAPTTTQGPSFGSTTFDDFDDFVSSGPPQVPAKAPLPPPIHTGSQRVSLSTLSKPYPAVPSFGSRQSSNPHERTASLLETAATITGRWPAPPSPLPPAIPPPSTSTSGIVGGAGLSYFDTIDETPRIQGATSRDTMASPTSSPPPSFTSSPLHAQPHGYRNGSSNFASNQNGNVTPIGVSRSSTPVHAAISPPLPLLPLKPGNLSQVPGVQQKQQKQQWQVPPLPLSKPLPAIAPPPRFVKPQVKSNRTGNDAPLVTRTQQPPPSSISNDSFKLFGSVPLIPSNVQVQAPANASSTGSTRIDGGGAGKLSAQDLSFFEGL